MKKEDTGDLCRRHRKKASLNCPVCLALGYAIYLETDGESFFTAEAKDKVKMEIRTNNLASYGYVRYSLHWGFAHNERKPWYVLPDEMIIYLEEELPAHMISELLQSCNCEIFFCNQGKLKEAKPDQSEKNG